MKRRNQSERKRKEKEKERTKVGRRHEEGKSQIDDRPGKLRVSERKTSPRRADKYRKQEGAKSDRLTYRKITHRLVFAVGGVFFGKNPFWLCCTERGG